MKKKNVQRSCVNKYARLTQLLCLTGTKYVFMGSLKPMILCNRSSNRSALTALRRGWKVPRYWLSKNTGIAHTHAHAHTNTWDAWFCLNDPFDWCLLASEEQSKPPSPALLAGSLSAHDCYASSFLRRWCHGALHRSIGWRNVAVLRPGSTQVQRLNPSHLDQSWQGQLEEMVSH